MILVDKGYCVGKPMHIDTPMQEVEIGCFMPFQQPDSYQHCGAKTRKGRPCKSPAMKNGRCRMHGGKTPRGTLSPHFKHGYYSKDGLARRFWQYMPKRYQDILARYRVQQYLDDNPAPEFLDYRSEHGYRSAMGRWDVGLMYALYKRDKVVIYPQDANVLYQWVCDFLDTDDFLNLYLFVVFRVVP